MNTIHHHLLGTTTRYLGPSAESRSRVLECGSGQPLFLLHGGGGHAETYARNLARLGEHIHVLAPDFLWHGMSACPPFREGNWLRQLTEQILAIMDSEGIERASFEGESLGAWIGLDIAVNFPDRLDKLVLNTAWGARFDQDTVEEQGSDLTDLRARSLEGLRMLDFEAMRKRLQWLVHDPSQITDEMVAIRLALWGRPDVRRSLTTYYDQVFSPAMDPYLFNEADLKGIAAPTLVLWTDHNPFQGLDAADRLTNLIPNSRLHVVEGAGHWPQWERPEEHDRAILDFLGAS